MKWGEVKLAALQKIDPAVKNLIPTRNTRDYLNAIIPAANRGLQDLSTAGKFIVKTLKIVQPEKKNLVADGFALYQHNKTDIEFSAHASAYYFEVDNKATVKIYVDGALTATITNTTQNAFTAYKGILNEGDVRIVFSGNYPYQIRNVALWDANFETAEDVWDNKQQNRYDLSELLDDFFSLESTDVNYEGPQYLHSYNYFWEGDSVLLIDSSLAGEFTVHYYSYPSIITADTTDDTEIELDPEVSVLLPIYMASELMYDDDPSAATMYRNQYEAGKDNLVPSINLGNKAQFINEYGW